LLKYDTNHRNYRVDEISFEGDKLVVGDKRIPMMITQIIVNIFTSIPITLN